MSFQLKVYFHFCGLGLFFGGFGLKPGGTGLVGLVGLGGLGGTGCGLYLPGLSGIGLGAGFGFGAGGSGLGTCLVMYQAWLSPLWQFQKITCLMWWL